MINSTDNKLSVTEQCKLLSITRSSYYYKPRGLSEEDLEILKNIDEIYTEHPYYGTRRMSKYLQLSGHAVGRKVVRRYYQVMGLEAVYSGPICQDTKSNIMRCNFNQLNYYYYNTLLME
jgi:putative transposase